jgi:F-type H+-transporting ATPase subunit delta
MAEVFREHSVLLQPALRHGVPDSTKRAIVEAIADQVGSNPQVRKLIGVLAVGGRFELLPYVADAYRERLLAHQNVVRAEVTSAAPLTAENTQALEDSLGRATGKKVELSTSIDTELIGGLIARIGSTVYDGSVRTQLGKIRQTLVK